MIARIEEAAFAAWPAACVEEQDGWRLRWNAGVTNRASSVWPNALRGDAPLAARIEAAEAFYGARGDVARFQLSPAARPGGLDAALAARGYVAYAPVAVQTAPTQALATAAVPADIELETTPELGEDWFELSGPRGRFGGADAAVYRALLERLRGRALFALARCDGVPVGVGLAVVEGALAGVFSMRTLPERRRRGVGRAVLRALAEAAAARGARTLYLQVERDNAPALALYAAAGFRTRYGYHYRRAPNSG